MYDIKEHLTQMRTLIDTAGWCQGEYEKDGKFCLLGASNHLIEAKGLPPDRWEDKVRGTLEPILPDDAYGLISWNDDPQRAKEDILSFLDRAIAGLGAKHAYA